MQTAGEYPEPEIIQPVYNPNPQQVLVIPIPREDQSLITDSQLLKFWHFLIC